ncbi:sphingosine kinase 1 [Protopterus annectens]|uniref:sphingosine kinase 1 n=1 Tax=Protopterus annectens TaxID=7888 RepID=UPI001CF9B8F8|nr:sphingosine kinase 1 [Protopterus annectens]
MEEHNTGAGIPNVLLRADFPEVQPTSSSRKRRCERWVLSLTQTELHLHKVNSDSSATHRLALADCIGCRTFREDGDNQVTICFSAVFYPLRKKGRGPSATSSRKKVVKTFRVDSFEIFEKNQEIADIWARKIKELSALSLDVTDGLLYGILPQPSRVLILLNPHSGKGQALQLFHSQVLPMLNETEIQHKLIVTERQNHAHELIQEEDLSLWDAVIIMSGDGLMYEVLNGIMKRPDWETTIKKPLGILPGGSGNALAASINHYSGHDNAVDEDLLINCTFFICKGLTAPMDLVSVTTSHRHMFSFLGVAWGFISDIDIESEKYRTIGSARFTVGTFIRLTSLRVYRGRLSYLPANDDTGKQCKTSVDLEVNGFCHSLSCKQSTSTPNVNSQHMYNACNSNNLMKSHSSDSSIPFSKTTVASGPLDSLAPPLSKPVPNHWTVSEEQDFILVLALYQSHLGDQFFTAPMAQPNDEVIHLFYVKAGISRTSLLKLFLAMEKGTHLESGCSHIVHIPVKAFRLEPFTPKGIITVDGEQVEYGPIQAEIHSRLGRFISGVCT